MQDGTAWGCQVVGPISGVICNLSPLPALLRKSPDGRGSPFPERTHPTASVTGMPSAVKPFSTATRTWNSVFTGTYAGRSLGSWGRSSIPLGLRASPMRASLALKSATRRLPPCDAIEGAMRMQGGTRRHGKLAVCRQGGLTARSLAALHLSPSCGKPWPHHEDALTIIWSRACAPGEKRAPLRRAGRSVLEQQGGSAAYTSQLRPPRLNPSVHFRFMF